MCCYLYSKQRAHLYQHNPSPRRLRISLLFLATLFSAISFGSEGSAGVDIRDHGAVCDGSADDTQAIISANAAATARGVIDIPSGLGACKITKSVRIDAGLEIGLGSALLSTGQNTLVAISGPIDAVETEPIFVSADKGKFALLTEQAIYANWFSGEDIGARWTMMKNSVPKIGRGEVGPIKFKVVGRHKQTTPMDWTGVRPTGKGPTRSVVLDFTEANIICATNGKPCLDLTDSRQTKILGGTIYGDPDAPPSVGYLMSRIQLKKSKTHRASGGFRVFAPEFAGSFKIAALYINGANTNNFIGGRYRNDGGKYAIWLGVGNDEGVKSPFLKDLSTVAAQADGNYFMGLEVALRGKAGNKVATFKNHGATKSAIVSSQLINTGIKSENIPIFLLDTSKNAINGFVMRDIRWAAGTGENTNAVRFQTEAVGNEFVGIRWVPSNEQGRSSEQQRATEVYVGEKARLEGCRFELHNGDDFFAAPTSYLKDCTIEARELSDLDGRGAGRITLGAFFSGEIRMTDPGKNLVPAVAMNAQVYDVERSILKLYSNGFVREPQGFLLSAYDAVSKSLDNTGWNQLFEIDLPDQEGVASASGTVDYAVHVTEGKEQCVSRGALNFAVARARPGGDVLIETLPAAQEILTCTGGHSLNLVWSGFRKKSFRKKNRAIQFRIRSEPTFDATTNTIQYSVNPLSPVSIRLR